MFRLMTCGKDLKGDQRGGPKMVKISGGVYRTSQRGRPHLQTENPNVHILGFRPSKTPPKFNEKTPRETQKERNGGGKGKKERNFWAVSAEGGPGKSKPATTTTTTTTTTPNPEQVGQRRDGPLSQARFRGLGLWGLGTTTHDNTQQHKTTTNNNNNTTKQHNNNNTNNWGCWDSHTTARELQTCTF